ncbi:MAG: acyltransferase [Ferruginibacter sp.]
MSSNNNNSIKSLQFLRCIAVSLVVLAHLIDIAPNFGRSQIGSFKYFENFGAAGVDIFFVISGCIMTIITSNRAVSPSNFLIRRCIRILPLYWAVSLGCIALSFVSFWPHIKAAEILQTLTVIPFFKAAYNTDAVLFLGWTLSFEFLFYLAFAIALLISKNAAKYIVMVILLMLVSGGFILKIEPGNQLLFFTNSIILEFLFGSLCGLVYLSNFNPAKIVIYFILLAAILLFLYSILFGYGNISEMEFTWDGSLSLQRVLRWGIPSFLLVAGMLLYEKKMTPKFPALFIAVGNSSYSAYLTHLFVIMLSTSFWHHAGFGLPDVFIIITLVLSLLFARLVYILFERPVTNYLNNLVSKEERQQ